MYAIAIIEWLTQTKGEWVDEDMNKEINELINKQELINLQVT